MNMPSVERAMPPELEQAAATALASGYGSDRQERNRSPKNAPTRHALGGPPRQARLQCRWRDSVLSKLKCTVFVASEMSGLVFVVCHKPAAVEAVGKLESRGFCGISKLGG